MRSNDKRPKDAVEHDAAAESPRLDSLMHEDEDQYGCITTFEYRADETLPKAQKPRKRKLPASKAESTQVGKEQTTGQTRRKR